MVGVASFAFAEPHQYQEQIRPAEVQVTPTSRGTFRATLSQMELHHLTLQHGWQSLPTIIRSTLHRARGSLMFQTNAMQPMVRIDGIDLASDTLVLGAPGEEHTFQAPSDCAWSTLTLTPATYAAARATLLGDDGHQTIQTGVVRPPSEAMSRLRALHSQFLRLASSAGNDGMHPQVTRSAEQALLDAVINCLAGERSIRVPWLRGRNGVAVIRKLHELLEANEGLPLYLVDVCAQLGVS